MPPPMRVPTRSHAVGAILAVTAALITGSGSASAAHRPGGSVTSCSVLRAVVSVTPEPCCLDRLACARPLATTGFQKQKPSNRT